MRINTTASLHAMASLQKDQILKVEKKGGKTRLVVMKKGKLTFCQKIWNWLGCGNTSFKRVLNVIAQIQKEHPEELKEKQFTILAGKIKKYKPTFCCKIKKIVLAKLPVASTKVVSCPKTNLSLTNEQRVRLLGYLKERKFKEIDKELTTEKLQLEFAQMVFTGMFEMGNDDLNFVVRDPDELFRSLEEREEQPVMGSDDEEGVLEQSITRVKALWAQTIHHVYYPSFESIQKQLDMIEKSDLSWSQKKGRLKIALFCFYRAMAEKYNGEKEQVRSIIDKFATLLTNQGEANEASTIRFLLLFLEEALLTKKEKRELDYFLLDLTGSSFLQQPFLDFFKIQTKRMHCGSERLPRCGLLVHLLHGEIDETEKQTVFQEYIEHLDLDKEEEQQLRLFVEKKMYSLFLRKKSFNYDYCFDLAENIEEFLKKSRRLFPLDREFVKRKVESVFSSFKRENFGLHELSPQGKEALFPLGVQFAEFGFYDFVDSLLKNKHRVGAALKAKCLVVLKNIHLPVDLQKKVNLYETEVVSLAIQETATAQLVRDLKSLEFPGLESVKGFIQENRALSKLGENGKQAAEKIAKNYGEAFFELIVKASNGKKNYEAPYWKQLSYKKPWSQFLALISLVEFGYEEVILKVVRQDEGYDVSSDPTFIPEVDRVRKKFPLSLKTQKLFDAYKERFQSSEKEAVDEE